MAELAPGIPSEVLTQRADIRQAEHLLKAADANIQAARAVAVAQYEKAIQSAFRKVSDALSQRSGWQAQREAQQAQHAADQARLELVQLKLAHGPASALDVLEAERSVLADQQALVLVQSTLLQNQIALYKALGGGLAPAP